MFGIDGWELLIIGVIAVIVLGPERLPKAARFAGLWVRRARAQWYSVKSELERELAADELKRSLQDTRRAVADIDAEITDHVRSARAEAQREFEAIRGDIEIGSGDGSISRSDAAPVEHPALEPPPALASADASPSADEKRDDRG